MFLNSDKIAAYFVKAKSILLELACRMLFLYLEYAFAILGNIEILPFMVIYMITCKYKLTFFTYAYGKLKT